MVTLGIALIVVGSFFSLLNWCALIRCSRTKRHVSPLPPVGALLLGSGMFIVPQTRPYVWIVLIADFSLPLFIYAIVFFLFVATPYSVLQYFFPSRFNVSYSFESNVPGGRIRIYLNPAIPTQLQIAHIEVRFDPPMRWNPNDPRVKSLGVVGKWHAINSDYTAGGYSLSGKWKATDSGFTIEGYDGDRELLIASSNGKYSTTELHYPPERKYEYDCLDELTLSLLN